MPRDDVWRDLPDAVHFARVDLPFLNSEQGLLLKRVMCELSEEHGLREFGDYWLFDERESDLLRRLEDGGPPPQENSFTLGVLIWKWRRARRRFTGDPRRFLGSYGSSLFSKEAVGFRHNVMFHRHLCALGFSTLDVPFWIEDPMGGHPNEYISYRKLVSAYAPPSSAIIDLADRDLREFVDLMIAVGPALDVLSNSDQIRRSIEVLVSRIASRTLPRDALRDLFASDVLLVARDALVGRRLNSTVVEVLFSKLLHQGGSLAGLLIVQDQFPRLVDEQVGQSSEAGHRFLARLLSLSVPGSPFAVSPREP